MEEQDRDFGFSELDNLMLNLMAGVHPLWLQEDEISLLKGKYGEDWMNKLGYTQEWLKNNPR